MFEMQKDPPITTTPSIAQPPQPTAPTLRCALQRAALLALVALMLLGLCVALAPDRPGVNQYLAAAAQARAVYRYDRALVWYTLAQTQAPQDARPLCGQGEIHALRQEWRLAISAWNACLAHTPQPMQAMNAWQSLGDAQQALGDNAAAQADWRQATALGSLGAERELAQQAEAAGDVSAATRYWSQLAQSPTDAAVAQTQLGYLALWKSDLADAQRHLLAAAAISPAIRAQLQSSGVLALAATPLTTAANLTRLGYALLAADLPALAIRPLLRATTLAPDQGVAHALLGWAYLQTAQNGSQAARRALAQREIMLGARLAPEVSFTQFAAGELALALGTPTPAIAFLQRGLAEDARNVALWSALGQAQLATHDYFSAEFSLQNAAQLSDDPADTITFVRYYVDHQLGLASGRALTAAVAAIHRWPGSEQLWYLLGVVNDLIGQHTGAYYAFTRAQALDPGDSGPYFYLGSYAEDEGNEVVAALDLRTTLAISPNGLHAAQARDLLAPIADIPV
ncbi:MAG: hypothetical protein ABI068_16285 [Ktedonobacterales bacterium]